MAKTMKQINAAADALDKAATEFKNAIYKFQKVYDPETVGLDDWAGSIDEVMFDIESDIQSYEADL